MYLDAVIYPPELKEAGPIAAAAERVGVQGLWTTETQHDPFLPLALAAGTTTRVTLGTAIAVAFPRSPTVTAHTAWDLARASQGRFILGLGTQVKAHIERRFAAPWDSPVARLRDYIAAVRAVWASWQTGERLRHDGEFYKLKLMTPFFNPGPLPYPEPPIYIAGVNQGLCRLAGEVCQGFHGHAFHTARYLREAILPWIGEGLAVAGRERSAIQVGAGVFLVVGAGAARTQMREAVRQQIAFYASTPSYGTLLALHGWAEKGQELGQLAARGRWAEMGAVIDDAMLAEFAVEGGTLAEAATAARARYTGLLDRISFSLPYTPGERDADWEAAVATLHA
ncbi:MAG TPA: TIGR03617 family F420-dependent LLM class oxidoreductase [Chloroflexia bacterium]|nr:TIGR03617 family F420-dependent LLM class oxidoreductase [Chloroflexia bacterium]